MLAASSRTFSSGSAVLRRSQRSMAAAHERNEMGRVLRCESHTDCSVRLLYQ